MAGQRQAKGSAGARRAVDEPLIVADCGGTNVRFALARPGAGAFVELDAIESFADDDFASLDDALAVWLERAPVRPKKLSLAFAGPISGNAGTLTNRHAWHVDGAALARRFGLEDARLFNDFAAAARGVVEAPEESFIEIKPGAREPGAPVLAGGPGTGFGMASVVPWGGRWRVLPGEGGHATFAPETDVEWAVARALRGTLGHVSTEVVAAGKHAEAVREALFAALGLPFEALEPYEVERRAGAGDPGCRAYCALRAHATMAAMGNAVLVLGAKGGVVIMGGVAQRLVDYFRAGEALARFTAHGSMSHYLEPIQVRLAAGPNFALAGAAKLYTD